MNADEFLKQIERADTLIDSKLSELYRLRCLVTSITVPTDREAIQTSGVSDKVGNTVAKIVDLENEIDDMIDEYIDTRNKCIGVIEQLKDTLQYKVIHMRYVEYKSYVEIEDELNYSHQWIMDVRRAALREIERIINSSPDANVREG
ncbi:MAG: DUF1492 domain-containing protein [Acutalibacteraceae bacterium]|nr:DUF1492 domain-containing protein [Acutalibacteraceae bacterium]